MFLLLLSFIPPICDFLILILLTLFHMFQLPLLNSRTVVICGCRDAVITYVSGYLSQLNKKNVQNFLIHDSVCLTKLPFNCKM